MGESFGCKEDGCEKNVVYFPKRIPGIMKFEVPQNQGASQRKKAIYLTCEDGHEHKYFIACD